MTKRSADDLCGIQPNSPSLFYRKIREVIVCNLELEVYEIFETQVYLHQSYFDGDRKGEGFLDATTKVVCLVF